MKKLVLMSFVMVLFAAGASYAQMGPGMMDHGMMSGAGQSDQTVPCQQDQDRMGSGMMGGYGMGSGMMGGYGMGHGMMGGYGMGHGMMGGCGMGHGMMGGCGMGHGMMGDCGMGHGMMGGYGMGHGMMGGYGMGHGMMGGYGMGHGMMGGYGMGHGMMDCGTFKGNDKFLDDTIDLRRQLHNRMFDYFEAVRNPKTDQEGIMKLENEIRDIKKKIHEKASQ